LPAQPLRAGAPPTLRKPDDGLYRCHAVAAHAGSVACDRTGSVRARCSGIYRGIGWDRRAFPTSIGMAGLGSAGPRAELFLRTLDAVARRRGIRPQFVAGVRPRLSNRPRARAGWIRAAGADNAVARHSG